MGITRSAHTNREGKCASLKERSEIRTAASHHSPPPFLQTSRLDLGFFPKATLGLELAVLGVLAGITSVASRCYELVFLVPWRMRLKSRDPDR